MRFLALRSSAASSLECLDDKIFLHAPCSAAVTLQKKRNFIAHGKLRATLTAGPPPVVAIDCTLTAMLGPDSLSLNASGLENLFYGLGYVAGKLHAIMKGDVDQMPLLASDEKSHLRHFLRNNPPTLPMPE